jgi:hypothetical protein
VCCAPRLKRKANAAAKPIYRECVDNRRRLFFSILLFRNEISIHDYDLSDNDKLWIGAGASRDDVAELSLQLFQFAFQYDPNRKSLNNKNKDNDDDDNNDDNGKNDSKSTSSTPTTTTTTTTMTSTKTVENNGADNSTDNSVVANDTNDDVNDKKTTTTIACNAVDVIENYDLNGNEEQQQQEEEEESDHVRWIDEVRLFCLPN